MTVILQVFDIESRPRYQGWLAQLVERRPYKANVGGSIPSAPTNYLLQHYVVANVVKSLFRQERLKSWYF